MLKCKLCAGVNNIRVINNSIRIDEMSAVVLRDAITCKVRVIGGICEAGNAVSVPMTIGNSKTEMHVSYTGEDIKIVLPEGSPEITVTIESC